MPISGKKPWKLLIDKDMNKSSLQKAAGVSWASIAKLNCGENIGTNILAKICNTLDCDVADIMEITHEAETSGDSKK